MTDRPTVYVTLSGGRVQSVISSGLDFDVVVLDFDEPFMNASVTYDASPSATKKET